jgi:Mor family transcriptional regulator
VSQGNLPRSIRDMIDVIGVTAALALVKAQGGIVIKVPMGKKEDGIARQRLIEIMGGQAADRFIAHYAGERLPIARCAQALRDERDRKIIEDYTAGTSVADLALREQMTERAVREILKRVPGGPVGVGSPPVDDNQMPLF